MEPRSPRDRLIVVGVSAGGLQALGVLLGGLPEDFAIPIAIVQHRSKESTALCELLQDRSALPVSEVLDKQPIEPGHVYLAPPDYHLLVEDGHFSLSVDEPVGFSRPSIDVAFGSAADAYGSGGVGVVLTGANHDGARGLRRIVDAGGRAVVQDPATADSASMPRAALAVVADATVLPLAEIAAHLSSLGAERE